MIKLIFQRHLILAICLFFTTAATFAQADSVSLKLAVADLDRAIINKDEKALTQLLNADVSYGHSNGWVETKTDIINDLKSGKLNYTKIENTTLTIAAINSNWATIRTNTNAIGSSGSGPSFDLKLHVLQVWLKTKNGWQLIARQATKLQ
jgi:hypothetical protein